MLKRKNDEGEQNGAKRVALDAEQIERQDIEEDQAKTAATATSADDASEGKKDASNGAGEAEDVTMKEEPKDAASGPTNFPVPETPVINAPTITSSTDERDTLHLPLPVSAAEDADSTRSSGPISSHKVEDPTYVHFRMLCPVKQASLIVGKGGEKISHIKETANCRINVSDNLRNVPERIVSVRGPAENVAKLFGLIVRAIVDEPENEPSGATSQPFLMKLLFPHLLMGYIIGKKGARFREIEENSAARLKLEERTLPQSTDRVLNVTGVADAIHIATYYIAQTVLENKQVLSKCIFYNPANYNLKIPASFPQMIPGASPMMLLPGMPMQMQMAPQMFNMMGAPQVNYSANGGANGGRQNRNNYNNGFVGQQMQPMMAINQGGERIEVDYEVPKEHIGLVIGKGGSNVKHIREVTKCYVKINPEVEGAETRNLTLQGTSGSIQLAIQMISNKVEHEKKKLALQRQKS